MTAPGVSLMTAATFVAVVGEIDRFPSPRRLVGYLGLGTKVRQSGREPAQHGRIFKQGAAQARQMLTEAAFVAVSTAGPMRAFYQRVRARRGSQIAIVAVARKLAVLFWHMLTRERDYAFARRRSPATSCANSSCEPAPSATQAAAASSTGAAATSGPTATVNANSPSRPSSPMLARHRLESRGTNEAECGHDNKERML
jgi:transposase